MFQTGKSRYNSCSVNKTSLYFSRRCILCMPNQQRTKFHPSSNFSETYPNNTPKCNVQLMLPLVLVLLLVSAAAAAAAAFSRLEKPVIWGAILNGFFQNGKTRYLVSYFLLLFPEWTNPLFCCFLLRFIPKYA